jgi:hypothetical protein
MQVPHGSRPASDLDVIILDNPHGDVIEISSSSCNLSIFSSKADSHHDEDMGPCLGDRRA